MNLPANGGRVPDVSGSFGRKPDPRTVTVSPAGSIPVVFDTVTVGVGNSGSGYGSTFDREIVNGSRVAPASRRKKLEPSSR
ncbi:MAG: hypothetical protein ACTMIR_15230, partial [Cellulomonadaceae bacterium]